MTMSGVLCQVTLAESWYQPLRPTPAILSDKNVLQIVDQTTDDDYSPEFQTAAFKKPAAGG
jgi:hypothetical protein